MGDAKGFLKTKRKMAGYRPVQERLMDFKEVELRLSEEEVREQGSRCMDCGVPFCHDACPMGNVIPDWNDMIFRGRWKEALAVLHSTNNFPEFTGRVCPALCEYACTLGINDDPVTVRQNEVSLVEWGFQAGAIRPFISRRKTGKRVAVVGSGPAGMACAQQLTRAGHEVTLFEADEKCGGILRYGIPDFKLEKSVIDRRIRQMTEEGLRIRTGVRVGKDLVSQEFLENFDAVCLTMGARQARDLSVEGRALPGIYQAMDYLVWANRAVEGAGVPPDPGMTAQGKDVVVIGGGDTGADCAGTANRQGARSVTQIELLPQPPECRTKDMPWPAYPKILKISTSHEEGARRLWSIATKKFISEDGRVGKLHCVTVDDRLNEVVGTDFELKAQLVILAMGFVHPVHEGLVKDMGLQLTSRGNISVDKNFMTSLPKVFAAGDASRGASLVVWAIYEGRAAAREIDRFLMGATNLP
ncbi:MAG: glutamate synthase subunit beta [Candidatus Omnitrophica bacterium]|nr:glutamate synthase subunit beta [Candidatus Omnitrophota bacterium]MDD5573883.1 glutamate synthase subunit beta [Candidatus Omnitrophota bacterium]